MANKISREDYEALSGSHIWDSIDSFHRQLEHITGITARSYVAYQYYDKDDNYIGDSSESTINDLLHNAYIEIEGV